MGRGRGVWGGGGAAHREGGSRKQEREGSYVHVSIWCSAAIRRVLHPKQTAVRAVRVSESVELQVIVILRVLYCPNEFGDRHGGDRHGVRRKLLIFF